MPTKSRLRRISRPRAAKHNKTAPPRHDDDPDVEENIDGGSDEMRVTTMPGNNDDDDEENIRGDDEAGSNTNITLTKKKGPSRAAKKAKISPGRGKETQTQKQETIPDDSSAVILEVIADDQLASDHCMSMVAKKKNDYRSFANIGESGDDEMHITTMPRNDDDDDEENVGRDDDHSPKKKQRPPSSPRKAEQQTAEKPDPSTSSFVAAKYRLKTKDEDKKKKAFACPKCGKVFSSRNGVRYHLEKNVCQNSTKPKKAKQTLKKGGRRNEKGFAPIHRREEPVRATRSPSNDTDSVLPDGGSTKEPREKFHQLKPGSKFITRYGVVEVIADDRLPSDYCQKNIAMDRNAVMAFTMRQKRFRGKQKVVVDQIAAGTRHRREELKNMYLESKRTCTGTTSEKQVKVWRLYCQSVPPDQILTGGTTACNNDVLERKNQIETFDTKENPRFPSEYYPDRIVECKLVVNKRVSIVAAAKNRNAHDNNNTGNHLDLNPKAKTTNQNQTVPMRLFIARRELTRVTLSSGGYNSNTFLSTANKDGEKEEKQKRVKAIEKKALSGSGHNLLQDFHGVTIKKRAKEDLAQFGNPHKIKAHKLHRMPPWLVFNAQRSAMYPEIYNSMEFKRGSQNRNHFNKLREKEGYVSKGEKVRQRKRVQRVKVRMEDPGGIWGHIGSKVQSAKEMEYERQAVRKRKIEEYTEMGSL